jgi:NAD(P)-dependent dehydrogenase (short-subunit alcohol dehydrogenase family)
MLGPEVLITGASSGIGKDVAVFLGKQKKRRLHLLGGRNVDRLENVQRESNAKFSMAGDLFAVNSDVAQVAYYTRATVSVLSAAINIDDVRVEERGQRQIILKERQNAFLEEFIERQSSVSSTEPRLFLIINSVASIIARLFPEGSERTSPYSIMKREQVDILHGARSRMKEAGIELSIVYPAVVDTPFTGKKSPEWWRQRFNILGKYIALSSNGNLTRSQFPWPISRFGPKRMLQRQVLDSKQLGKALGSLVECFLENGEIPESLQEWLILHSEDMENDELMAYR